MKPAVKARNGRVVEAKRGQHSHADIGVEGQRGFTHKGEFLTRQEAAKIAKIPGVTSLHSHHLRKR